MLESSYIFLCRLQRFYPFNAFNYVLFLTSIPFSGLNFCPSSKEYTHGVVIRFRSSELSCILEHLVTWDLPFWQVLFVVTLCSWSLGVIHGQHRIQRCKDINMSYWHLDLMVWIVSCSGMNMRFLISHTCIF